ncbi:ureidoglycolate lyase [Wenxinia saemankumensis]|uniref:Ureidoglycolate lyase n=1 Tax=Wenxinia saemankumensis TaxID=1447782 RepID=A0A1M6CZW8_9RHOB|nr:ureidoglycolate lyase [Wenxinia saemankumensis]SHI66500.1 ureidoglycolate lyase [Wenxinia saemankumensis]
MSRTPPAGSFAARAEGAAKANGAAPRAVRLLPPDPAAFAPYGEFVEPPSGEDRRRFYSAHFDPPPGQSAPVLHTNRVPAASLPLVCDLVERHPHAAQVFLPLDVARYAVLVMPADEDGAPVPSRACGFLVPGTRGVVYRPGTWHMGATALDRDGHFAVLMWRGGPRADDEFRPVPPITLTEGPP